MGTGHVFSACSLLHGHYGKIFLLSQPFSKCFDNPRDIAFVYIYFKKGFNLGDVFSKPLSISILNISRWGGDSICVKGMKRVKSNIKGIL